MNDQFQSWNEDEKEHIHTMENEDQPLDENVVNPEGQSSSEIIRQADRPEEKTETWKTSFPAPAGQVNIENSELLNSEEVHTFRSRWNEIQAKFVDEPGASVRQADALVAEVMAQVTQTLANQRRALESQWNLGDASRGDASHGEASTEDLRQILQSYRSFFNRLLK
jgi:hypothetical protein